MMNNNKKMLGPVIAIWAITFANVMRMPDAGEIRPVLFASILALGAVSGVLIAMVVTRVKDR